MRELFEICPKTFLVLLGRRGSGTFRSSKGGSKDFLHWKGGITYIFERKHAISLNI